MPKQIYDMEQILDACISVFARNGYEKTSTAMLAEAAGISRTLIFHHFKNKKELYLTILDRCIVEIRAEIDVDALPKFQDFFKAREQLSITKFESYKKNPHIYNILKEAFNETPVELKEEIEEKYGMTTEARYKVWRELFEKVLLKEGVDREEAFRLVMLVLDNFDNRYLEDLDKGRAPDDNYFWNFLNERNRFLDMVRYGIEG